MEVRKSIGKTIHKAWENRGRIGVAVALVTGNAYALNEFVNMQRTLVQVEDMVERHDRVTAQLRDELLATDMALCNQANYITDGNIDCEGEIAAEAQRINRAYFGK